MQHQHSRKNDWVEENNQLRYEIECLKDEVGQLQAELRTFSKSGTIGKNKKIKRFLGTVLDGKVKRQGFDMLTSTGKKLLIRVSSLTYPTAGITKTTKRWQWHNVFGINGKKEFDNLILVGDIDERHKSKYQDNDSCFVIFDIPYQELEKIIGDDRKRIIKLSTNPMTCRGQFSLLFNQYQMSEKALLEKYKIKHL